MLRPTLLVVFLSIAMNAFVRAEPNPEAWWAKAGPDGVQRINIVCGSDFIDPPQIVLRAHTPVELAVSTTSDLPAHNFKATLPRLQADLVDMPLGPRQTRIAFVPALLGSFQTACRDNTAVLRDPFEKQKQGVVTVVP